MSVQLTSNTNSTIIGISGELAVSSYIITYGQKNEKKYSIDLVEEFKKRTGENPYGDKITVLTSAYIPGYYFNTNERAKCLPSKHPSTGGIWIIWKKSDGSDASIGLTFFDDLKDMHHQIELWWRDFKGNKCSTKDVCGHQMNPKEDVEVFITMTSSVFVIPRLKNEVI